MTDPGKYGENALHTSDCAIHNAPAYEAGQCDCHGHEINIRDARIAQLEGQLAKRSRPTEAQITYMVNRFLSWRLPEHFNPDGGISFDPIASKGTQHEFRRWPVGTNLLAATQADEMVRYMLEGLPSDESQ